MIRRGVVTQCGAGGAEGLTRPTRWSGGAEVDALEDVLLRGDLILRRCGVQAGSRTPPRPRLCGDRWAPPVRPARRRFCRFLERDRPTDKHLGVAGSWSWFCL